MSAPAICAMNMDLGLLMVMCPVLKSCSRPLKASGSVPWKRLETYLNPDLHQNEGMLCNMRLTLQPEALLKDLEKKEIQHPNKVRQRRMPLACMSVPADDVAAMTKPATARPAITPPFVVPDHTANTKMATCNTRER